MNQGVGLTYDANDLPVISFATSQGSIWLAYDRIGRAGTGSDAVAAVIVDAEQITLAGGVGLGKSHVQNIRNGAIRPDAFSFERNGLNTDHTPISDVHFWHAIAIEVADLNVGYAAVRIFDGVFRKTQEPIPFVIQQMTSLLGAGKGD